jgi:hypothetical protein
VSGGGAGPSPLHRRGTRSTHGFEFALPVVDLFFRESELGESSEIDEISERRGGDEMRWEEEGRGTEGDLDGPTSGQHSKKFRSNREQRQRRERGGDVSE